MASLRVSRKHAIIVGAGMLVLLLIAVIVLMRLSQPASGRLKHDDTLQTTRIDKVWQVEKPKMERCLVIRLKADVSGNARPTWGLSGPVTVWEHMRIHNATLHVEAKHLGVDGDCSGRFTMRRLKFFMYREDEDRGWKRLPNLGTTFGKGAYGTSINEGFVGHLEGGTYDRGDSYETVLGVYVEPTWTKSDKVVIGDGATVEDTFEVPVDN